MTLLRNVGTIGGLTAISRVFGFARDILLARVLGAGGIADAWQLAFQLPNLFRRLFAEGAFASAFVPLFNRHFNEGEHEAKQFASEVLAVLLPILVVFGALFMIAMPWILYAFANEDLRGNARNYALGVQMARIAFPYLLFMSLASLVAAVLNSLARFAAAAAAPIILNLFLVLALIYGMVLPGGGTEGNKALTGLALAIAVSASGLAQLVWLVWWMHRGGFRLALARPRLTRRVREMGVLIVPAVFGAGVYQISRFVDLAFMRGLPDGSLTHMAMADRWNQLPLGIIGIALGTAILPALSRMVARDDQQEARHLQSNAVELSLLLTIPAAVALFFCGTAIVRVFMEGGEFTPADATITGAVLSALVLGLPAYVLVKVLTPNFFARRDTKTPVYTAAASLVVTVLLNLLLVPHLGVVALAAAGSIGAWFNTALLYAILVRRGLWRLDGVVLGQIGRITLASACMGAVLWYAVRIGENYFQSETLEKLAALAVLMAVGGGTFVIAGTALRILDRNTLARLRRRAQ